VAQLILTRASASRSSGEWNEDDYDVLCEGVVVGRIFKVHAAPVATPWMWTPVLLPRAFRHRAGYELAAALGEIGGARAA